MILNGEYKELCENVGGMYINVTGNTGKMINPLQIRKVIIDDDEKTISYLALHLQMLKIFFKILFTDITQLQLSILIKSLEELYNEKNIFFDTDINQIKNTEFPILSDLYEYIEKKSKVNKSNDYKILLSLLREICYGSGAYIFNGYTNIEIDSGFTVFDTSKLQDIDVQIKRAQYYNVLSFCWDMKIKNKNEHTLLFCDEAWILVDNKVPECLVYLRNIAKRARKYNSGIVVISHSLSDFLDDNIKQYGQSLLDMANYKIIMGSDGKNLEDVKKLYKLTDAETQIIFSRKKGIAIFLAGNSRSKVKFEIPEYEFKIFRSTENEC